jgi:hypothetical protein
MDLSSEKVTDTIGLSKDHLCSGWFGGMFLYLHNLSRPDCQAGSVVDSP